MMGGDSMPNILDYLAWRGDIPLAVSPWNEVDSLLLSALVYNDLGDRARTAAGVTVKDMAADFTPPASSRWAKLPQALAGAPRFAEIVLCDFVDVVDPAREMQFAAVTALLPDGTAYVAFRGTDNTLVGWRENFNMSFESPVAAQMEAVAYLERAALRTLRPLRVGGHSKGGNLASYAAAGISPESQARLIEIHSFDGPGLDDATIASPGYARIRPTLRSVLPRSSVIGLLLNHHAEYAVVASDAVGLQQHDPLTWQVLGTSFVRVDAVDKAGLLVDDIVHDWLRASTPEQRRSFVDSLFDMLDAANVSTLSEMGEDKLRASAAIISAARKLDPEARRIFLRLAGQFLRIGAVNLRDHVWESALSHLPDNVPEEDQLL